MHQAAPENLRLKAEAYQKRRKEALEALGGYQKKGIVSLNLPEISDLLMDESDRGVVVILGSMIEDLLLERILKAFTGLSSAQRKNLTRSGGLLGNFDHRINLAEALGLITADTVDSLQIMKAMRNACAHSRRDVNFGTPELKNVLALLFGDETGDVVANTKEPFFARLCLIAQFVVLSEIVQGTRPDVAQAMGQTLFDNFLAGAKKEAERVRKRRAASRERRSRQQAQNLQTDPKG